MRQDLRLLALCLVLVAALLLAGGADFGRIRSRLFYRTPISADVQFWMDPNGMSAEVTNLNNFTWKEVEIYANQDYRCDLSPPIRELAPGGRVRITTCYDDKGNPVGIFSSLRVKSGWDVSDYQARLGYG